MAKAQQDFNEYCDKHITPRLQEMRKQERLRFVVPMTHESELDE